MFLEPGKEVLTASNGNEVIDLLPGLTPTQARLIGRVGMKRIQQEHTYAQRADQFEKVLNGKLRKQTRAPIESEVHP